MQQAHLNIDALKAQRTQVRRSIETIVVQANSHWNSKDTVPPPVAELKIIGTKLSNYETMHEQFCHDISQLLTDPDEFRTDFAATCYVRESVWETHSKLTMMLDSQASLIGGHSRPNSPASTANSRPDHKRSKLPQIKVPKFSGAPMEYQEFIDAFESIVDSDSSLAPVDKLHYLRMYLEGEALQVVKGFRATNDNYEKALQSLKERFGNKQLAIFAHMREYLRIPMASNDTKSVREVFDKCTQHIRSLEALGLEQEKFGPVFTSVLIEKLPQPLLHDLTRQLGNPNTKVWDLSLLTQVLNDEILVRSFAEWSVSSASTKPNTLKFKQPLQISSQTHFATKNSTKRLPTTGALSNLSKTLNCCFCGKNHYADECSTLKTADARKSYLKDNQLCLRCLRSGHFSQQCERSRPCYYCKKDTHHSSICFLKFGTSPQPSVQKVQSQLNPHAPVFQPTTPSPPQNVQNAATSCTAIHMQMAVVHFPTAKISARVFFDNGSSCSYVTSSLAKALNLPSFETLTVSNARFEDTRRRTKTYSKVQIPILCLDGSEVPIDALVTDAISCPVQKQPINVQHFPLLTQIRMADPPVAVAESVAVDILVGSDHYFDFVNSEQIRLGNGIVLVGSKLGYLTAGRGASAHSSDRETFLTSLLTHGVEQKTLPDIERFWSLEDIGVKDDPLSKDDDLAIQQFNKTVCIKDGRYEVGWLWKPCHPDLPDNEKLSIARLKQTVKSLRNQPEVVKAYDTVIQSQHQQGIIEQVDRSVPSSFPVHYLPHRHVLRPDRPTTKLRVVHDASARSGKLSPSLNDCMFRGPIFLGDLAGLLIRFRTNPVALTSDIEKAFLQISLREEDRDVTRFFWLKDPNAPVTSNNLVVFRFRRILFGVICCPSILGCGLNHKLSQEPSPWSKKLLNDHFVDNAVSGVGNTQDAISFYRETKRLLSEISMNLCQWQSNSSQFLESIPAADRAKSGPTKVLGISWDPQSDTLSCINPDVSSQLVVTKRDLLSAVSKVFDPLGLLSPVVVRLKLLVQDSWKLKIKWDQPLPDEIRKKWSDWKSDLDNISTITIPRFVGATSDSRWQLHSFCDASGKAYACAVYVRPTSLQSSVTPMLLFSKSRLAPTKPVSLPRLELMAIVLGVRSLKFVAEALKLTCSERFVWTDSKCALSWIQSSKVQSVFVSNRVREIKSHPATEFRYVPTNQNPADLPTRGTSTDDLSLSNLWWNGPRYLSQFPDQWPRPELAVSPTEPLESASETMATTSTSQSKVVSGVGLAGINVTNFSSLSKLIRVTSLVLRAVNAMRHHSSPSLPSPFVTAQEFRKCLLLWVANVQATGQDLKTRAEFENQKRQLGMFLDCGGILRCKGRLEQSDLVGDALFPAYLPADHPFTWLVILDAHTRLQHAGPAHTLSEVRQGFWVPSGLRVTQRVIRRCSTCRMWEGGSYATPPFPPLPNFRASQSAAFTFVGLDYLGPFHVKAPSGTVKAWISLFTCASTRAIHLEVVSDLTTQQFLLCLRRFVSRFGSPQMIVSDNAKQFKLAQSVLTKLWSEMLVDPSLQKFSTDHGITWKFIPEYAPWMGGFYERLVGSVKRALKKVLGRSTIDLVSLQTLVAEVACTLNRRPLVQSNDINDPVLTPAHLIGTFRSQSLPQAQCEWDADHSDFVPKPTKAEDLIQMWKKTSSKVAEFWEVWSKMYLTSLRESQYKGKGRNRALEQPCIGDTVLIKDKDLPRSLWKVGRILELQMSSDGIARSAKLQLPFSKTATRPITALYPIESKVNDHLHALQARDTEPDTHVGNQVVQPKSLVADGNLEPEASDLE